MKLSDAQKQALLVMLKDYQAADGQVQTSDGTTYTSTAFDLKRQQALPELRAELIKFMSGQVGLREFKETNELLCRKHDYWGFKNFSGQMYLNQLTNWSDASEEMESLMRKAFVLPKSRDEAAATIDDFQIRIMEILPQGTKRIRKRSTPFLLSYFWQVQDPEAVPMHFSATNGVFEDLGILNEDLGVAESYKTYWEACEDIATVYADAIAVSKANRFWFSEHVFYFMRHKNEASKKPAAEKAHNEPEIVRPVGPESKGSDYAAYLPAVISDLAILSKNGAASLEYERKVGLAFRLLGFELEQMGQGKGRNPDGIAYLREFNFAVLFDAKAYTEGYVLGQEDRKFIEYIQTHQRRLRKEGYTKIVFVVVSDAFKGDSKESISRIRQDSDIRTVKLLKTEQLLRLLAAKISDPLQFDAQLPELISTLFLEENGAFDEAALEDFLEPFDF